jgi:tRNA dimethylallyltransferase
MESKSNQSPLVVIVGETASGKTALAIELAQKFNGEIICADSRTIYKGMDIGTAKPNAQEQAMVPHHLINVVRPDQTFTAADFKQLATAKIKEISERGHIPFLVGGTGLYVDAVVYDFDFAGSPNVEERKRLQQRTIEELQAEHLRRNIPLPENAKNPRHLIRSLETGGRKRKNTVLRPNTIVIGLSIEREKLLRKLTMRVEAMVERGFIDEVKHLADVYGWDVPAMKAPGYKAFREYLDGQSTVEQAKALFVRNDFQLAKRQRTWFKRNKSIHWVDNSKEAVDIVTTFLNK